MVEVKGVEGRVKDIELKVMVGFDSLEVVTKLFPCHFSILIVIIRMLEEELEVLETNFRAD